MNSTSVTIASPQERLRGILPDVEIAALAPLIEEIDELKVRRNAVVLAHNYMTPDIYHGVADLKGDSLALARMTSVAARQERSSGHRARSHQAMKSCSRRSACSR